MNHALLTKHFLWTEFLWDWTSLLQSSLGLTYHGNYCLYHHMYLQKWKQKHLDQRLLFQDRSHKIPWSHVLRKSASCHSGKACWKFIFQCIFSSCWFKTRNNGMKWVPVGSACPNGEKLKFMHYFYPGHVWDSSHIYQWILLTAFQDIFLTFQMRN